MGGCRDRAGSARSTRRSRSETRGRCGTAYPEYIRDHAGESGGEGSRRIAAGADETRAQDAVPPEDSAGDEHDGGGDSEQGPGSLGGLVAEAGAFAGNADAADAAEVKVGEPVNDAVANAQAGVGRSGRLKLVGDILEDIGKGEIDAAEAEDEGEGEGPKANHAVQMPDGAFPAQAAGQDEAAAPGFAAGPPDDEAGNGKQDDGDRADAIDFAAGGAGKEIVVEIEELGDEPDAEGDRVTEVASGPGIEEAFFFGGALAQPDIHGVAGDEVDDALDAVAGIEPADGNRELGVGEARPGTLKNQGRGSGGAVQLVAINEHAAGDADHEDIEADGEAAPQVNLEEGSANPEFLRLTQPAVPEVRRVAWDH